MNRRKFLKTAGVSVAASALAAPAIAQQANAGEIRWRLASSFPKSLDTIFGAAEYMAKKVSDMTGGKFQIRVFAAGEIVPAFDVVDAVQANTVELCHTASYYFFGKDPTFAFDTAVPFGLNSRQQTAWLYQGGGRELMNDFYKGYNIYGIPCGNTGTQMGGWYRKEIKTVKDLDGLKMRIGGFAGTVLLPLGVVPQQIPGGDIYPSLEKGTIDAAEWVGPYDDEKLGFYKVANNYYYPGWWEGSAQLTVMVNTTQWNSLSPEYKAILEAACAEAHTFMQAKYDVLNPAALRRLQANGTKLHPFTNEIMAACLESANKLYDKTSAENPRFKKVYDAWRVFRDDEQQWFQVAENTFDNFQNRNRAKMAPPKAAPAKAAPAKKG